MPMKESKRWVITLLLSLSCALSAWGMEVGERRNLEKMNEELMARQMEIFLISTFELNGSWDGFLLKVQEMAVQSQPITPTFDLSRQFRLWSADNLLLWSNEIIRSDTASISLDDLQHRRVLLLNGQNIGYFDHMGDSDAALGALGRVPLLLGMFVFLVVYIFLTIRDVSVRSFLKRLQDKLGEMMDTKKLSASYLEYDLEPAIWTSIKCLEERIHRLETIRKSMVADIAHELRTPLSVMRAQLDNVLNSQTPIEPERAALLQDEVYRMSKLLGDMEQLALAESGHLMLNRSWFSLLPLLSDIADAFQLQAEEAGIRLTILCPEASLIYADQNRLRQVFVNLIGNAIRYARSEIFLDASQNVEGTTYLITVVDDGEGLEEEDQLYIFERFYRGTTKRRNAVENSPGLGLGLPIVKQWVQAHGGTVEVHSSWNKGTEFLIKLPVLSDGPSA